MTRVQLADATTGMGSLLKAHARVRARDRCGMPRWALAALVVTAALSVGCEPVAMRSDNTPASTATKPLTVYTVNYPLAYMAERIGADRVDVVFPAPADGDPAAWAPGAQDIAAYQRADLILLNGAGYAGWTGLVSLPEAKVVDTSAAFAARYITEAGEAHTHGGGAEHRHEAETAFTTWLDPQLAIQHAAAIRDALAVRRPAFASEFQARFADLEADLTQLDQRWESVFASLEGAPLVFSHPVYQYLERRYALNGLSVHWEPGEQPGDDELAALAQRLVRHPARLMIWEGQPLDESVRALSNLAMESTVLDPCGNRPAQGDYLSVMDDNLANVGAAISAAYGP